ncbi:MAG: tetratricopeptide repeat protein, partial [Lachnospiraceae bacterium]
DNSWVFAFANIAIGIAIGLAAAVFLILPMRVQSVKKEYQQKEQQLYAQLEVTPAPASVSTQSPQPTVLTEATGSPAPTDIPAGTPDPEQTAAPTAGATQEEKDVFGDADLLDVDMSRSAEYYYELAQQNFSYEEYDDSKMFAQQALVIDPEHLESLYYLGRSYQMLEDNERAVKVYEKMVSLYPDSTKWQIQDAKGYLEELQ